MSSRTLAVHRKIAKKVVRKSAPAAVVVKRPASPARTAKTFGVGPKRSKHIDAMVAKAVG